MVSSKERHKMISVLRKEGTFLFNTRNQYNDGHLIVCRRPHNSQVKKGNDYKPCPSCKDFYSKNAIRRHYTKCSLQAEAGKKNLMPLSRAVQGHIHKKANMILRSQIFPRMREDCHTDIVRYDELAIVYGNYLTNKYRKPHLHTMIRSKLRLIGRLLNAIKNINKTITDFSSIFQPKYYDEVIAAVNKVAILGENNSYHSPATAFSYGTLMKKCAKLLVNECIKKEDEEKLKKCRNFQSIIEEDFASSVNKTVEENQKEMRRHKKVNLPTMNDVRKLKKYLDLNRNNCFDFLTHEPFNFGIWTQLSECTLTSVQMFNRRRAGEIERITIEDFKSYEAINENVDSDIFNSLSEENKTLAKQYVRFEIRGKLGRPVPVLLHLSLVSCIELILNKRGEANVSTENPYVFGLPGGKEKYLKACTLLRKFSNLCGAQQPATLRGTELRKHIATHCVLLNLQEGKLMT
ncbi:hypothetical protein WA026_019555 [Henosepilachna vigintioctopunctata]|uniref:Uncharacterized protein n=1 Tax=Henosepilachna vigintioctopunctata TaxID=420089 RepID=A0AAW1TVN8_9CUCU